MPGLVDMTAEVQVILMKLCVVNDILYGQLFPLLLRSDATSVHSADRVPAVMKKYLIEIWKAWTTPLMTSAIEA